MKEFDYNEIDFPKTEAFIKLSGNYQELYSYNLLGEIIKHHANDFSISITDDVLQAFSNQARRALNLHSKKDFDDFLNKAEADYDLWGNVCENELSRMAMKNKFADNFNYVADAWPIIKSVPGVKETVSEIIISKGKNSGIELTDEVIKTHSDNLRRSSGLHKTSDLENYLSVVGMDVDGWEKMVKSDLYHQKLLSKNIIPITSEDLVMNRQISDSINKVISELVFGHFVKTQSEKLSITVSDEDIQNFSNDFRRVNNLHDTNNFKIWLDANQMTLDDFEIVADLKVRIAKFNELEKENFNPQKINKQVRLSISFLENAIRLAKESKLLKSQNINELTEKELQDESDSLRRVFKLHNAKLFNNYLDQNGLTIDNWQDFIDHKLKSKALRNKLASDEAVIKYLSKNKVLRKTIKDDIFTDFVNNKA